VFPGWLCFSGDRSVLVAGVDRERRVSPEWLGVSTHLLPPLADILESPGDDGRDELDEITESRLRPTASFWVSMAAGGFLLRRLFPFPSSNFF
jgi:hypothetical protein